MEHIMLGWIEGYSCNAFYRKLKDMQDSRELLTVYEEEAVSESNPRLRASSSTKDEKLDMVLRWLQDVTI